MDPANGMVTVTGNSPGDTATYTCNDGYILEGSASQTCGPDGAWSDVPPTCRPIAGMKTAMHAYLGNLLTYEDNGIDYE